MNKSTRTFHRMNNSFSWVFYSVYMRILRVYVLVFSKAIFEMHKAYFTKLRENLRYEDDFFHNIECFCKNNIITHFLTILIPNLFWINSVPLVNNFTLHCCRILLLNFYERRNYANDAVSSLFEVFSKQN